MYLNGLLVVVENLVCFVVMFFLVWFIYVGNNNIIAGGSMDKLIVVDINIDMVSCWTGME